MVLVVQAPKVVGADRDLLDVLRAEPGQKRLSPPMLQQKRLAVPLADVQVQLVGKPVERAASKNRIKSIRKPCGCACPRRASGVHDA